MNGTQQSPAAAAGARPATRQQEFLKTAYRHVSAVDGEKNEPMAKIYGGLCHKFPVLLRTAGLSQTVAFIESKANGNDERSLAWKRLREHVSSHCELRDNQKLIDKVQTASVSEYMLMSRRLLAAWVYYKRFAVSILKVTDGQFADNDRGDQ